MVVPWSPVVIHGHAMVTHDNAIVICGNMWQLALSSVARPWPSMVTHGNAMVIHLNAMGIHDHPRSCHGNAMIIYGNIW